MKLFVFLSEIIGRDVVDKDNNSIGKLHDISMRISDEVFPRADGLVISRGLFKKEYAHVNINDVVDVNDVFRLGVEKEKPKCDMVALCKGFGTIRPYSWSDSRRFVCKVERNWRLKRRSHLKRLCAYTRSTGGRSKRSPDAVSEMLTISLSGTVPE